MLTLISIPILDMVSDTRGTVSMTDETGVRKNVILFGVNNSSSSAHDDDRKKDILILSF